MSRKKGRLLIAVVLVAMAAVVVWGLFFKDGFSLAPGGLLDDSSEQTEPVSGQTQVGPTTGSRSSSSPTADGNTLQKGSADVYGLRFTAGAYSVTRSGRGLMTPWNRDYALDADGNLPAGYTYLLIPLTIENISDEAKESSFTNNKLVPYQNGSAHENEYEATTIGGSGQSGRNTLHYQLQPGETKRYTVAYAIPEKDLQRLCDWVLDICPQGRLGEPVIMHKPGGKTEVYTGEDRIVRLLLEKE